MNRSERAAIRKLVTELCANYDSQDKICLPLDSPCYMLNKWWTGAYCRYFEKAVLPVDAALESAITGEDTSMRHVVVQLVWIAAFLVSTKFEHFRCQPPGKISYCCFGAPVLCTGALFCTLFLIGKRLKPYRCRSPPSDFDFCHQLKHRNWRKLL